MVDALMTNPGGIILGKTGTMYGAKMVVEWEGLEQLRANLLRLVTRYPDEAGAALYEEGLAIMGQSLLYCPYDQNNEHLDGTPHLNETGKVTDPTFEDNILSIILSYDTPYAVLQHEVQEYHHDIPEQWKYLEHPMNERSRFMAANLAKGIDFERMIAGSYKALPTVELTTKMEELNKSRETVRKVRAAKQKYGNQVGRFL